MAQSANSLQCSINTCSWGNSRHGGGTDFGGPASFCTARHCRWRLAPNQGGASCQQPHSIAIAAHDHPVAIVLIRRDALGEAARSR
jgi:hypothetical protein